MIKQAPETKSSALQPLATKKRKAVTHSSLGIPKGTPELIAEAISESGLSYSTYVRAITANALSDLITWTQSDLERLIVTAKRHGLNPLNREIFMLSNAPELPPLIAVGVDGWAKIMNAHPQFAGMSFAESTEQNAGVPAWIECEIHRNDRVVPLKVREYFEEARSDHMSWITHPRRMLRHKCMVQCARLAFGLGGIVDADEAPRIRQAKTSGLQTLSKGDQGRGAKGISVLRTQLEAGNQSP